MVKMRQMVEITMGKLCIISTVVCLVVVGCQQPCPCQNGDKNSLGFKSFGIADARPVALSKIVTPTDGKNSRLKLLVEVVDEYANRIKTPFLLRIEFYEYQKDVPQNIGRRLNIWPDIDLTDSDVNSKSWNDFLRCYEFDMDLGFVAEKNSSFVTLLTCFGANGERITKHFTLTAP